MVQPALRTASRFVRAALGKIYKNNQNVDSTCRLRMRSAEVFQRQRATVGHAGAPEHTPVLLPTLRRVVEATQRVALIRPTPPGGGGSWLYTGALFAPTASAPSVTVTSDDISQCRENYGEYTAKPAFPHALVMMMFTRHRERMLVCVASVTASTQVAIQYSEVNTRSAFLQELQLSLTRISLRTAPRPSPCRQRNGNHLLVYL